MTDLLPPAGSETRPSLRAARPPGAVLDRAFRYLTFLSGLLVLVILVLIAYYVTNQAWPAFRYEGLGFITSTTWNPAKNQYGALGFIYGTLLVSAIAVVLAVPISVGIALFVTELAPRRVRRPIVWIVDLLAAIPSVVFGLWGLLYLSQNLQGFYMDLSNAVQDIPVLHTVFGKSPSGKNFLTAGIILALMITPIITSLSREVFSTTPTSLKEGAVAMGATRWEMIRAAVFPHSRSGMTAAVLLGLARAIGETIVVALVLSGSSVISANVLASGGTIPGTIVNEFGEAEGLHRSALMALAVILFGMTLAIGVIARRIINRSDRRLA